MKHPSRTRTQVRGFLVLRLVALAAAALAVLDPRLPLPASGRAIVMLMDGSDSMGSAGRSRARELALAMLRDLPAGDRVAVAAFAGSPRLLVPESAPAVAARLLEGATLEAPAPGTTDLATALAFAASAMPGNSSDRSIVLFGDGRATSGAVPDARGGPDGRIALFAVPLGERSGAIASASARLPLSARPGESVAGTAAIVVPAPGDWELETRVDGRVVDTRSFTAEAGERTEAFRVEAGTDGQRRVDLILRDGSGEEAARGSALLSVGSPGSVLVVGGSEDSPSPVAVALSAQGLPTLAKGPSGLPSEQAGYAGISCVVLDDLSARSVPAASLSALSEYVAGGGGLLVAGGMSSLGRGEYYDSPLDPALPVDTDIRKRLLFTRARLLFIVDSSGSMGQTVGQSPKQLAAMRAVAAALGQLNPQDEVGILSFDSQPHWVWRFAPAADGSEAIEALSSMPEGGGTDLAAGVLEALRAFGPPGPTKRHAILMSDGLSSDFDPVDLAGRLKEAGVTLSAVAIGDEVNDEVMRELAEGSGGYYHRAELDAVPLIASEEAASLSRDLVVEGTIPLSVADGSDLGASIAAGAPPVGGYLLVRARPTATVHLEAARLPRSGGTDGGAETGGVDPVLVEWRYGSGKAAVFASDSGGRWLSSWSGSAQYNRLWAALVRRLERPSANEGLSARAYVEGSWTRVVAEARDASGRLVGGLRLSGRTSDGLPFELAETAPGLYEGRTPVSEGLRTYRIAAEGESGPQAEAWAYAHPGAESPERGRDDETLARLARESGGTVLDPASPALPAAWPGFHKTGTRAALTVIALAAFLLELFRRSALNGRLGRASAAIRAWGRERGERAEALETPLSRQDLEFRRRDGG